MSNPPRLTVSNGRVHGTNVLWNDSRGGPWPCGNGDSGAMRVPSGVIGVIEHTMVGSLAGTVAWFNNSQASASAHFGIGNGQDGYPDGQIWQFGPVNGWMAWHAASANPNWYGIEHADGGDPARPLTRAQVDSSAQLAEVLSRPDVGRFSLQVSDSGGTEGYGWHGMGGADWGGHYDCPGTVRRAQRSQIVTLARSIRSGGKPAPRPRTWTTGGRYSLWKLATTRLGETPARILEATVAGSPGHVLPARLGGYVNEVFASDNLALTPAGITWKYLKDGHEATWETAGRRSLHEVASVVGTTASGILSLTLAAGLPANTASYLNAVFERQDAVVMPAGTTLCY